MFSGIVVGVFPVSQVDARPASIDYRVTLNAELVTDLKIGASVSIDGVCQTVTAIEGVHVRFQAIQETLEKTTLSKLIVGRHVCVERSLRVGDENGGHDVSGHVFGKGRIYEIEQDDSHFTLLIEVPKAWMKYIIRKGFIAIDGVSLTVGDTNPGGFFELHLIPETLRRTGFANKNIGDEVNVELDYKTRLIVDVTENYLQQSQASLPGQVPGRLGDD